MEPSQVHQSEKAAMQVITQERRGSKESYARVKRWKSLASLKRALLTGSTESFVLVPSQRLPVEGQNPPALSDALRLEPHLPKVFGL